jgi:hypothetical protein
MISGPQCEKVSGQPLTPFGVSAVWPSGCPQHCTVCTLTAGHAAQDTPRGLGADS